MFTLNFTMNLLCLLAIIAASAFGGFYFRHRQVEKCRIVVSQLEQEMENNLTEILELQQEYVELGAKLSAIREKDK